MALRSCLQGEQEDHKQKNDMPQTFHGDKGTTLQKTRQMHPLEKPFFRRSKIEQTFFQQNT
jgi:hypothetical protein